MLQDLVDSYGRGIARLRTDLADVIGATIAGVDRPTVEAHLERPDRGHIVVDQPVAGSGQGRS